MPIAHFLGKLHPAEKIISKRRKKNICFGQVEKPVKNGQWA